MRKYRVYHIFTGSLVARLSWRQCKEQFGAKPDHICVLYPILFGNPKLRSAVTGGWLPNPDSYMELLGRWRKENLRSTDQCAKLSI